MNPPRRPTNPRPTPPRRRSAPTPRARPAATTAPAFRRAAPDTRRDSLIAACASVLARDGVGKASVRTVAAQAGVSAGLVGHYFPTMDALVAATYADVGLRVNAALEAAVAAAGEVPRARLDAFVMANFTAPVADPELLGTWIAFWGLARGHPAIAAQHDAQYAAFRARLERLLADSGVRDALLRQATIAVTAMIDGLWLELCLSSAWLTADEAGAIARLQLDYLIDRSVSSLR